MHTFRHRIALRTIGCRFGFLVTKDVLQLLQGFILKLRALIGMGCLRRSEDTIHPFDKIFRNGWDIDYVLYSTRSIETRWNGRSTGW